MSNSSKKKTLNNSKKEALPKKPSLKVLKQSDEEMENFDATRTDYQINIDAIAGLAFIENVKSGQTSDQWNKKGWNEEQESSSPEMSSTKEKTHLKLVTDEHPYKTESKYGFKTALYLCIILGSLYGTFLLINSTEQKNSIAKTKEKTTTFETRSPKRIVKDKPKKTFKRNKNKRSVRRAPAAASFRESEVFKKHKIRKLEDNPVRNEEEDYNDEYDDGREPIENDPLRANTSKEIINPEDDYFDEEERDIYDEEDGERSPSSQKEDDTWVNTSTRNQEEESEYEEDYGDEEEEFEDDAPFEDAEQF